MKKKVLFLLIPLIVAGLSGCVKYNGQGKPGKKSSEPQNTSEVAPTPSEGSGAAPTTSEQSQDSRRNHIIKSRSFLDLLW